MSWPSSSLSAQLWKISTCQKQHNSGDLAPKLHLHVCDITRIAMTHITPDAVVMAPTHLADGRLDLECDPPHVYKNMCFKDVKWMA